MHPASWYRSIVRYGDLHGVGGHRRHTDRVEFADLRLHCAARVAALADAIRGIPPELAPVRRASTVAIREQIYFGWERPMASARGVTYIHGKYEVEGWWSVAAARLVNDGLAQRGQRMLEREHVMPASEIVREVLAEPRNPEQTADLLDQGLVTCTVLAEEHRRLRGGGGWERYAAAGITVQRGLSA